MIDADAISVSKLVAAIAMRQRHRIEYLLQAQSVYLKSQLIMSICSTGMPKHLDRVGTAEPLKTRAHGLRADVPRSKLRTYTRVNASVILFDVTREPWRAEMRTCSCGWAPGR